MTHNNQRIAVLAGPTASGKTAFAIRVAQAMPAVIINADAMQMVSTLRVLSARPTEQEERQAEHALYGVLPATTPTSVALWLAMIAPIITAAWAAGKLPLLVGGTGMYTAALMHGISSIPPIPADVREALRLQFPDAADGTLHAALAARDPAMAAQLKPGDTQRLLRALEVIEATGQSLDAWQKHGKNKLFPAAQFDSYYLNSERSVVYDRINRRFDQMMQHGALEEVQALMAEKLHPDTPILRAHGVPELMAYLRGEVSREEAVDKAKQHTRNYAKRQYTWIKHQLPDAIAVAPDADVAAIVRI